MILTYHLELRQKQSRGHAHIHAVKGGGLNISVLAMTLGSLYLTVYNFALAAWFVDLLCLLFASRPFGSKFLALLSGSLASSAVLFLIT